MMLVPENIFPQQEYHIERRKKIFNMTKDLQNKKEFLDMPRNETLKIMKEMENAIFKKTVELAAKRYTEFSWNNPYFKWIYHDRCYYVITNMLGSNEVFDKVIGGQLQVRDLLELEPHELRNDLYKSIIEMEQKRSNVKITVKTNDMYVCGKCKKSQTRSEKVYSSCFDESIPVLVTCLNCNHSWRM